MLWPSIFCLSGAALLLPLSSTAMQAGPAAPRGGTARATVEVAVLNRPVQRGERLSHADFTIEQRAASLARGAVSLDAAAGMETLRTLNSGSVVRVGDIITPRMVRRGEPVLIAYKVGTLTITTQGRALASAGVGEPVRVTAISTQRTLDGVVAGQGLVRVAY